MHTPLRFCIALGLFWAIATTTQAKAVLQGTVSFLNSGSRPAAGVKISAFGANDCYTTDAGMFRLEFPDKKPGDKVKIIVGSNDKTGLTLELVNDKVVAQVRVPSNPDDDIVEIIVCKVGQRNDAALRYNGLIVKTINETMEKRLKEIDEKLGAAKIDAETIVALQNEKEKLAEERDSALAKAEEQALYIASINLDKASQLVKDAVFKVDRSQDIQGAIAVLDNEILLKVYEESKGKMQKAQQEIENVIEGFKLKISLLGSNFQNAELNLCCLELEKIYTEQLYDVEHHCFTWATLDERELDKMFLRLQETKLRDVNLMEFSTNLALAYNRIGKHQKSLDCNKKSWTIESNIETDPKRQVASTMDKMADMFMGFGDYHRALNINLEILQIKNYVITPDTLSFSVAISIAVLFHRLARIYLNQGNYQKSIECNMNILKILENRIGYDHPDIAWIHNDSGYAYAKIHQFSQAKEQFENYQKNNTSGTIFRNWAMYYALQNDKAKALENLQKAISLGYKDLKWIETDDSLESIRGEQGYKEIVEQLKKGE